MTFFKCIAILQTNKADDAPEDVQMVFEQLEVAKTVHDHILDKRGPVSNDHRTFSVPFDKKLRKKKKYREAKAKSSKRVDKVRHWNIIGYMYINII
jgi:hypothetical protein